MTCEEPLNLRTIYSAESKENDEPTTKKICTAVSIPKIAPYAKKEHAQLTGSVIGAMGFVNADLTQSVTTEYMNRASA